MDREEGAGPVEAPDEAEPAPARRVKASSLLWFISNRPYVPMADIRRRFGLMSEHGTLLRDERGPLHLGLPEQAATTLLDLRRRNKIEFEYDYAYEMRVVIGVFPLRVRANDAPAPRRRERADLQAPAIARDGEDEPEQAVPEEPTAEPLAAPTDVAGPRRRRRSRTRRMGRS